MPLLEAGALERIVFVDDGSKDATVSLAECYPVTIVKAPGLGPGGARNLGWRETSTEVVWFIDSDCVAEPDALSRLLRHFEAEEVAGVGGSYGNMEKDSLLACLIHDEIRERHLTAREPIDFLGGFNVAYRREALETVGGFEDSRFNGPGSPGAEDADLSYRIADRGGELVLETSSMVGHFHPTRLVPYLRTQARHGRWAVQLYRRHPGRANRNSYSGPADSLQVPLAALTIASIPCLAFPPLGWICFGSALGLALLQLPMATAMLRRTRRWRSLLFVPLGFVRAFARIIGVAKGVLTGPR